MEKKCNLEKKSGLVNTFTAAMRKRENTKFGEKKVGCG